MCKVNQAFDIEKYWKESTVLGNFKKLTLNHVKSCRLDV